MKTIILFTTALSVSLDSFFCGLSMSVKTTKNFKFLLGISFSVFLLCILGSLFGASLYGLLSSFSEIIGGSILIIISVFGFIENLKEKTTPINTKDNIFLESVIIGFAIGLDGAVGCLSLSLMGYNSLLVPILITFVHVLLMNLAILISKSKLSKFLKKFSFTPPLILFLLGLFKLVFSI